VEPNGPVRVDNISGSFLPWAARAESQDQLTEESDAAARYRLRAEELRTIAGDKTALEIKHQLLKLAEDYERMATSADAVDKTNKILKRVSPR
jgi:hypothetical protein